MTSPHQASHVVRPTAPKQPTRRRPKQEPFQFGQVLQPKDDLIGGYIVEHDRKQIRIDKNTFEKSSSSPAPRGTCCGKWGNGFIASRSFSELGAPGSAGELNVGRLMAAGAAGKNCASPWSRPPCCFLLLRRPWPPRNFFFPTSLTIFGN